MNINEVPNGKIFSFSNGYANPKYNRPLYLKVDSCTYRSVKFEKLYCKLPWFKKGRYGDLKINSNVERCGVELFKGETK